MLCLEQARTVSEVMQEVRGFFTLGHLLYAYAYLRMLHYKAWPVRLRGQKVARVKKLMFSLVDEGG